MDSPSLSVADIPEEVLTSLLVTLPWASLQQLLRSTRLLSKAATAAINNPYFWQQRILHLTGIPYIGPHPMTLAAVIEAMKEKIANGRFGIKRLVNLLLLVNIPEFINFFIAGGFKIGTSAKALDTIMRSGSLPYNLVNKEIFLQYVMSSESPVEDSLYIRPSDLLAYVIPFIEDEKLRDRIVGSVEERLDRYEADADAWDRLLQVSFVRKVPFPAFVTDNARYLTVTPEYLLGYATDVEATRVLLESDPDTVKEVVRVAYLKGLGSMLSPDVEDLYFEKGLGNRSDHLPQTPMEVAEAIRVEYKTPIPSSYIEIYYNLARIVGSSDGIELLVELGLDEHIRVYLEAHPEARYYLLRTSLEKKEYAFIRRHPELFDTAISTFERASINYGTMLIAIEEAGDIAQRILGNAANLFDKVELRAIVKDKTLSQHIPANLL